MAEFDSKTITKGEVAFKNQSITSDTTTVGEPIDTIGFESLTYHAQSGALNAGAFAFLLFESDDGTTNFTAVPVDNTIGSLVGFIATEDDAMKRVGTIGKKQFQRIDVVSTGASGANFLSIVGVLGNPKSAPTE